MPESFIENYKAKHQHPLNKLTHSIGIPMIVISLPLFFFNWRWALALFVVGWVLQFVGHAIEGQSARLLQESDVLAGRSLVAAASCRRSRRPGQNVALQVNVRCQFRFSCAIRIQMSANESSGKQSAV